MKKENLNKNNKMKTIKHLFNILMLTVLISMSSTAQVPASYEFSLRNDGQVSETVFEFDIYLLNKDLVNVFELDLFQAGIKVNPAIVNGGTITASIVAGSSQLVAMQQPTTGIVFASNCIKIANPAIIPHGFASIISTTSPGLRIARIRLTNTVPFGMYPANLTFNFTPSPYNTAVFAYNQTSPYMGVNITNSIYFTVSNLTNGELNSIPTPINLMSFDGQCTGDNAELTWVTATEINNDYFTIQKSKDDFNFEDAAKIKGAGNSNSNKYYSLKDKPYENRITYYRLKQTDFDGKYSFSKTISTDCSGIINNSDYCNFIKSGEKEITIHIFSTEASSAIIKIYDISGKEIATLLNGTNVSDGLHTFTYNFIEPGIYIIEAIINNKVYTNKIIL